MKLVELKNTVKDLEEARKASLNLIEDLSDEIEKRKSAEANLKETQLVLKATLESPVDMIILAVDMDYNYLSFNSAHKTAMKAAYGSDVEPGMNILECIVGEEDIKNSIENYSRAMKGESFITVQEYGEIDRSYYESFYNPIRNENNEIVGATAFARNITERIKSELALKESEEKFRNLFEHSPVGKSMTGVDGSLNVNMAFCNILGYTSDELKLKNWKEISHPGDIPMTDKLVKELINGKSDFARFEKRYIHKNGSIVFTDVATYLQCDNKGKPEYFITTINDITDRKLAESNLFASQERYSLVISASEQGIWDWNVETNDVFFSEQWKKQIGYEDTEIKNDFNSWIELLHPDEKESCLLAVQSYLNNPVEHFMLEFRFRHKDGSYRIIHNKSASVKNAEGKVLRMFGTHTDITEQRRAEEEIKKLNETLEQRVIDRTQQLRDANRELEAFSYSVSHDLRAPLRAIHSFTSILKEDYKDLLDVEGKRICGIIESSSVHMGGLIDDLLAFSRISRTEIQHSRIDMERMVQNVVDDLLSAEDKKNIKFNLKKLPAAFGDFATIRQVMINLISNAIKYSSKNESPEITVGCEMNSKTPVYYVKDNGVGFNMQYEDKLFRVFQRLHSTKEFDGNGVGLAIVHRIISKHEGKVWAEGEVEKGATFFFTLPEKNKG